MFGQAFSFAVVLNQTLFAMGMIIIIAVLFVLAVLSPKIFPNKNFSDDEWDNKF